MANKLKERLEALFKGDKKLMLISFAAFAAILLILLSELAPSQPKQKEAKTSETGIADYARELEAQTEQLISSISGAGKCKVMITLKNSNENIYAKNTDESIASGSNSFKNEYVLYEGQDGEQPVLIKQYLPCVQGVAVVCEGADKTAVRESVVNCVSSLFDIPVTKISVSKYKG